MTLVVSILSNREYLYLIIKKTAKSIQQPLLIIVLSCPLAEYIGYRFDHYYTENDCQPPYSFPYYHQQDLVKNKTPQQQ